MWGLVFKYQDAYTNRLAIPIIIIKHFVLAINPEYQFNDISKMLENLCEDNEEQNARYYGFRDKASFDKILYNK